jgi:hypothetical protein
MLSEPLAVTLLVADALERLSISYFVTGSLASALHGILRATLDADVVAEIRLEHGEPLAEALGGAFYVNAEAIRDAVRHKNSFNAVHKETMFKVDVFVSRERPFDQSRFSRRIALLVAANPDRILYAATAEDTILAKLEWYRMGGEVSERQWRDVVGVLETQSDRLDHEYLSKWACELDVLDLLARALTEAGIKDPFDG